MRKLLALIIFFLCLSGCRSKANEFSDGKPVIYTSFYAVYDLTKQIGGDKINLKNIMPPGIEPHDWEISTKDILQLENADALFYNGAGLEHWIDKVKNTLQNKITYLELAQGISVDNDPHVWLNPLLAKKQFLAIKDCLIKIDPQNENYYEQNYDAAIGKIDDLDKKIRACNFKSKNIVVAHQAYKYFCDEYGLTQIPLEGIEEDAEPTVQRMKEVTDFIKQNNIKYIFSEATASKAIETIAHDTNTKILVLNPFEYLTEEQIQNGEDYFSIMEQNLANLKAALE